MLIHSVAQFIRVDGFQQVIQRAEADGFDGKLVVRGGEDDVKIPVGQGSQQVKTVLLRHYNIEKHQIGLEGLDVL